MNDPVPAEFREALSSLKGARARPEIHLTEIPPPTRIAPWALALTAEVNPSTDPEDMLGHGRFVALYDPAGQAAWHGTFRIIVMAAATIDSEMGMDPLLAEAGWSWLLDSLEDAGAGYHHVSGTVTRTMSESFGGIHLTESDIEMEIRASWTPNTTDLAPHLDSWLSLLSSLTGLPPMAPEVTALTRRVSTGKSSTLHRL
ncbi:MAG: DUF3000 domain-containing protein [Ruaniaceae bacterium]|nr:DUF3000 domain-containing protein [Ruaniaceae bacterium]